MITIRCSSLDRVAACPASAVKPTVRIETQSEAASMGSAVHEGLASRIQGADFDPGELAECWSRGLSDPLEREDVLKNVNIAHSLWNKVAAHFVDPVTEHEFEPALWHDPSALPPTVQLTGHADVLSLTADGREVLICDHKTGFQDGDHEQQMRGYAYLALRENDGAEKATAVILRTRLGVIDTFQWTREELNQWADDLFRRVIAEREVYRPSVEACGYCPRAHECPARRALTLDVIEMVDAVVDPATEIAGLDAETLAFGLERLRFFEGFVKQGLSLIKTEVINRGGSVTLPDGRELRVKEVERTEIDVAAGYNTLEYWCGDLRSILKIGKGDAVELCRSLARKGEKKKDREAGFLEALDQAGALKVSVSKRLELVKAPKLVTVEN